MGLPRGIRNNNPGNIRWGNNWRGLVSEQDRTDEIFCQFTSAIYGIRSIIKLIFSYREKYSLDTIESIINRYAPPNENNTSDYIKRVCNKLNIQPNDSIDFTDEVLACIVKAICSLENGEQYTDYYSCEIIDRAIQSARL